MVADELDAELRYMVPMRVRKIVQYAGGKTTLVESAGPGKHIAGSDSVDRDRGESAVSPSGNKAQARIIRSARPGIAIIRTRVVAATEVPSKANVIYQIGVGYEGPPAPQNPRMDQKWR